MATNYKPLIFVRVFNGLYNKHNLMLMCLFFRYFVVDVVQWVNSLGSILWDFDKLYMEFSVNGRKIALRGAKPSKAKLILGKALNVVVLQGAEFCFLHVDNSGPASVLPTCFVMNSGISDPTLPRASALLLEHYADIFGELKHLSPPSPLC